LGLLEMWLVTAAAIGALQAFEVEEQGWVQPSITRRAGAAQVVAWHSLNARPGGVG
jgi:hypothetical protein